MGVIKVKSVLKSAVTKTFFDLLACGHPLRRPISPFFIVGDDDRIKGA